MPLDDFFAKKEKKKSKKKQNPESLIKKLINDSELLKDQDKDAASETSKVPKIPGDDEWENIDDEEKEIDLATIRISKLSANEMDESSKAPSKDKDSDNAAENEGVKKVWGSKPQEVSAPVEETREPEPEPVSTGPQPYVPVHLRQGPTRFQKTVRPDVESASDFPSLDVATSAKPTVKPAEPKVEEDDSWEQAGVRKPRPTEKLPIAINPPPSTYVPPSLRQGHAPHAEPSFEHREFRSREDRFSNRPARGPDSFGFRDQPAAELTWSRGQIVSTTGQASGFAGFSPRSSATGSSSTTSSGWDRGATVKTFRDTGSEKNTFELVQSNRFAGLSET